jgi:predicted dithiol-disulfide oxidoreductase (DUF899 family)
VDLNAGDVPMRRVRLSEIFTNGKKQTEPCPMCTMWIDGYNGVARHLAQNLDFAIAAAADLPALRRHARNRGWKNLRLLSCGTSTFKYDLGSEDETGEQDSTLSVWTLHPKGATIGTRASTTDGETLLPNFAASTPAAQTRSGRLSPV